MSDENASDENLVGKSSISRRKFLKRAAIVGFAAPLIASFAFDAASASSQLQNSDDFGNQGSLQDPDVSFGNQFGFPYVPNQFDMGYYGNQVHDPLAFENVVYPNQYYPNQAQSRLQP